MNDNKWSKSMDRIVPYIDWNSIKKELRTAWEPVRHSNITFELHVILEGSCKIELDDNICELKAGEAIVIMPNTFHACRSITKPFLRLTAHFILQDQSLIYKFAGNGANHVIFEANDSVKNICRDIFEEYDKGASYLGNEMLCALFSRLMIELLRTFKPEEKHEPILYENGTINIIDRYFSSFNLQGGHTRKGLSRLLHCSERQINRILADLYGMTFLEKRLQARMDYAKFLLRNTELKIPEISNMVGYSNETSFYKLFKSNCNLTPQEFRKKYQSAPQEKTEKK